MRDWKKKKNWVGMCWLQISTILNSFINKSDLDLIIFLQAPALQPTL